MPARNSFWTPRAEAKIAEHGVTKEEVEQVLQRPFVDEVSRSNPRNMWAAGETASGRYIVVIYREIDDSGLWVAPITAYEPSEE